MDKNLFMMIELQKALSTIERLDRFISEGPSVLEEMGQKIKEEEERFLAKKSRLESLQKEKREQEGNLQMLNTRLEKYKNQIMSVKTNKEYTAMLHEIELCTKEVESVEEDVIVKMYEMDSLENEIKSEEENFIKTKKMLEDKKKNTEQELKDAEKETESLKIKKEELKQSLPEDLLQEFFKIFSIREGLAVAIAKDGICQSCKLRIRPQVYIELKSNNQVVSCENCDRFLYWDENPNEEKESKNEGDEATAT